jgi:hypothetical protein
LLEAEVSSVSFAPAAEIVEEFAQLLSRLGELVEGSVDVCGWVFDESFVFEEP